MIAGPAGACARQSSVTPGPGRSANRCRMARRAIAAHLRARIIIGRRRLQTIETIQKRFLPGEWVRAIFLVYSWRFGASTGLLPQTGAVLSSALCGSGLVSLKGRRTPPGVSALRRQRSQVGIEKHGELLDGHLPAVEIDHAIGIVQARYH